MIGNSECKFSCVKMAEMFHTRSIKCHEKFKCNVVFLSAAPLCRGCHSKRTHTWDLWNVSTPDALHDVTWAHTHHVKSDWSSKLKQDSQENRFGIKITISYITIITNCKSDRIILVLYQVGQFSSVSVTQSFWFKCQWFTQYCK